MKKIFLAIAIVSFFTACDDNRGYPIWDVMSAASVVISVENANGDNLLNPYFEGNILDNDIHVDYNGKTYAPYTYDDPFSPPTTRALPPPEWYGLMYYRDILLFGEFGCCRDEKIFTIYWGDGTSDEVKFFFDVEYKGRGKNRRPYVYLSIWLNGKLQSDNSLAVEIVK